MKPIKKIMVPVDFSAHAAEAIKMGGDLSRRFDAALTLVHVYEPVAYNLPEGFVLLTPNQHAHVLSEFDKRLAAVKADAETAGGLRVETQLLQGSAAREIVDFASKNAVDLIVIGTHGRTGLQHALMGSVAERVVRTAPCPVLTLKA